MNQFLLGKISEISLYYSFSSTWNLSSILILARYSSFNFYHDFIFYPEFIWTFQLLIYNTKHSYKTIYNICIHFIQAWVKSKDIFSPSCKTARAENKSWFCMESDIKRAQMLFSLVTNLLSAHLHHMKHVTILISAQLAKIMIFSHAYCTN